MRSSLYFFALLAVLAVAAPIPQEPAPEVPAVEAPIEIEDGTPTDIPEDVTDDIEFIEVPPIFPEDEPLPVGTDPSLDDFTSDLDFGQCSDPTMIFLPGINGRRATEFTFLPNNSDGFFDTQGEALDAGTIANFICDNLVNSCRAGQDAIEACKQAKEVVRGFGDLKDQSVADAFNAALGFSLSDEPLEEELIEVPEGEAPTEEAPAPELPVDEAPAEEAPVVEDVVAPAVAF
jgi:hypothetical protein